MENILNLFKKVITNIHENNFPSSIKYCSSLTFSHKWTIANYSRLYDEDHPWKWEICSKDFSPPNNDLFKFQLCLRPKGHNESVKDYVSIGVGMITIPEIYNGKIRCRWNVSIEDENGDMCNKKGLEIYNLFCKQRKINQEFIEHSSLLNCSSILLPNNQLTLHFEVHLQADEPIFNVITNNKVDTSRFDCANKVTRLVHTWTIEKFGEQFESSDIIPYFIQSDHFPALNEQSEQFCLRLYPNGLDEESKDNVEIEIWNDNENSATVHWRISILDVDGEECYTEEWTVKIETKIGRYFGLNRDYLLHNSNGFVHNNQLRIYCEMSYMMDSIEGTETVNHAQMSDSVHKSESITDLTKKAVHFVSHQWTIEKFSAICFNTKTNHSINSQIFKSPIDTRFAFQLNLFPKGNDNNKEYVSLDLYNASRNFNQVTVQYRISIIGKNNYKWTRWSDQSTISKCDKVRNSKFVSLSFFQDTRAIDNYLPDDKLTILCELWVLQDRKIYKTKSTNPDTQSLVNNPSGSATISLVNSQGVIVNVNSPLNMNDFNSNYSNNKN